jgi:tetratricopeptide (TPR) repeat protein
MTLAGVAAIALLLRAIYLWEISGAPFSTLRIGDAAAYHDWARRIAAGDWLGEGVFYQAPLYPYFLAVLYSVFGEGAAAVRAVHAVMGAIASAVLAWAGVRLFGPRGAIAGLLLAVFPTAIFLEGLLEKSALATVLTVTVLALAVGERWLACGVALGLLALARENALVLLIPILLWIGRRPRAPLALLGGCAIALGPVALHNLAAGGELALTTAQFGPNFYIGNHAGANGTYIALEQGHGSAADERADAVRIAEQAAGRPLAAKEVSSYWTARAVDYIRSQPIDWLKLTARKLALVFHSAEAADSESAAVYSEWSWLLRVLSPFDFGVLVALAAAGVVATRRECRRLWLLYAIGGAYVAGVALFYVFDRYRFPLAPVLMLLAAGGAARFSRRDWLPAAAIAAVALVATHLPVGEIGNARATHYFNIGAALARERPETAAGFYRRALDAAPGFPAAHHGLAHLLTQQGRPGEAIPHFRATVAVWPDYAEARHNFGVALAAVGQLEEAAREYTEALRLRPGDDGTRVALAKSLNNLGAALANQGRVAEAIAYFERAAALSPEDENLRRNLEGARRLLGRAP